MTQIFDESQLTPVTVIEAGPCVVLQLRTLERDGYEAVQIGFADKPIRRKGDEVRSPSRAERGHVRNIKSKRQEQLQAAGVDFTNWLDADGNAFAQVGSQKLPRTYLLDPTGKILWFDIEYSLGTRRELNQALRAVAGEPQPAK